VLKDKIGVVWLEEIKKILDKVGYSYFWNEGKGSNTGKVVHKLKERLHEQGIQQWRARKEASGSLSLFSMVKDTWREEVYFMLGLKGQEIKRILNLRGGLINIGEREMEFKGSWC